MLLWSLVHKYLEFLFSVLSGISLGVKFLDYSMVILNLHYWGATKLFPIADASLYTASVMHLVPGSPHPHPYLLSLFNYTFSSRCQLAHPWGFHLLFLMINQVDHKLPFDKHRNHQTKPANSDVPKDLLNESKVHWKRCWSNWASQRAFFLFICFSVKYWKWYIFSNRNICGIRTISSYLLMLEGICLFLIFSLRNSLGFFHTICRNTGGSISPYSTFRPV